MYKSKIQVHEFISLIFFLVNIVSIGILFTLLFYLFNSRIEKLNKQKITIYK